jgi:hypothetical protein
MRLHFHIEGGRNRDKVHNTNMRLAFNVFFSELAQHEKSIVQCTLQGSRSQAYRKFCHALKAKPDDYNVLLVDSENPVQKEGACWQHVKHRPEDNWDRPDGANDDQCQLMVQAIEAWFFADPEALTDYYGKDFRKRSLPHRQNVEDIPKDSHIAALEAATRQTQKRLYHKCNHLPDILTKIDPLKVRKRAPHCDRIFTSLGERIKLIGKAQ